MKHGSKSRGLSLTGYFLILALLLSGCGNGNDQDTVEELRLPVNVLRAELKEVQIISALPGATEPAEDVWLAAEQSGVIEQIAVEEGDRVNAEEKLLQVDSSHWRELLNQARIEAEHAARDAERYAPLVEEGALSDRDHDQVLYRRDIADVALKQAEIELSRCDVFAPLSGIIESIPVEAGEYVNAGEPVVRLVDLSTVFAVVNVPERDVVHIKSGVPVPVKVTALDNVYTGRVDYVAAVADPATHTYRIKIALDNSSGGLRGGMLLEAEISRGMQKGVIVPLAAVVPRHGEHFVFIEKDGFAAMRRVQINELYNQSVVVDGVLDGENIIIDGHRGLRDGSAVRLSGAAKQEGSSAQ